MAIVAIARLGVRRHARTRLLRGLEKRFHASGNASRRERSTEDTNDIPVANVIAPLPLWQRLGLLSTVFSGYSRSQRKRPLLTQFCSSLVIYFFADLSAQSIGGDEYNSERTARSLVIGGVSSIPSYKWFLFLGESFNYSSKLLSLATKVVVNQIVFTPLFNSYFFGMQSFLAGDNMEQVIERIKATVPTSIVNSCKLWPIVTAFSFTYIQPQYRSLFAGFIAIGWQSYLSWLNRMAELKRDAVSLVKAPT